MNTAFIAELLEPFFEGCPAPHAVREAGGPLTPAQLDHISTYIDLLLRWNARINLTAIRKPEEIVSRHFGESLFLARHLFPRPGNSARPAFLTSTSNGTVVDLGSGAGFPALPLKIWAPEIHLTLIESNHKKVAFLRETIRSLTLTNVNVIADRAEAVLARLAAKLPGTTSPEPALISASSERRENPPLSSSEPPIPYTRPTPRDAPLSPADVVTFRAIEKFDQVLPAARGFLAPAGCLALLIGQAQISRLTTLHDLQWACINIPQSQYRVLAIGGAKVEQV